MHTITKLILITSMALGVSGCTKTWSGLKQDSSSLWEDTREAIHEATSTEDEKDEAIMTVKATERSMQSSTPNTEKEANTSKEEISVID